MNRPSRCSGGAVRGSERGFTLIELILTIVLLGIIGGVVALVMLGSMNAYVAGDVRADLTDQGRLAVERMAREIRGIVQPGTIGPGPVLSNPSTTFSFTDSSGTTLSFDLAGSTLNRSDGATTSPLAADVSALAFRHFDRAGAPTTSPASVWTVSIDLTVTRSDESQTFQTLVHPRNFP